MFGFHLCFLLEGATWISKMAANLTEEDAVTVTLDDLIPIMPFKEAILKVDIEMHEPFAIIGNTILLHVLLTSKLFNKII